MMFGCSNYFVINSNLEEKKSEDCVYRKKVVKKRKKKEKIQHKSMQSKIENNFDNVSL